MLLYCCGCCRLLVVRTKTNPVTILLDLPIKGINNDTSDIVITECGFIIILLFTLDYLTVKDICVTKKSRYYHHLSSVIRFLNVKRLPKIFPRQFSIFNLVHIRYYVRVQKMILVLCIEPTPRRCSTIMIFY